MIVNQNEPEILNVRETAERLQVHENTVRNWARKGILQSARVPGASVLSFHAKDVDRLREKRGAAVASVEEERRVVGGPELVDANQLSQWASTREAQHVFPELMRRLLAATPDVTNISVRAGEGVSAPGWDGRAESEGTAFLPKGALYFEFGVSGKPRSKAEADYTKRRENPAGANPSESTFVFATPRRWSNSDAWVGEKRTDGAFANVCALDADDLEGWLQQTPAVHHWISERLGRRPQDATTLEQWWEHFQARTKPPLPASLFLAGRERESEQLATLLQDQRPQVVAVQSTWRDDAIAFVWATVARLTKDGKSPHPPLVVRSDHVWDRVADEPGRMTLLPLFDNPDPLAARQAGHHIVVPLGWDQTMQEEHIQLPPLDRHDATKALEAAGLDDSQDAYQLSALARRSLPSLIRKLARSPSFGRPAWTQPPDGSILAPLVLVGSWSANEDDTALLDQLTGKPWAEIEETLLRWRNIEDPPFVRPGTQWHLASAQEAFLLLRDLITATHLHKWEEISASILLERDPKLDLGPEDRPMASIKGAVRKYSPVLRKGLAQGVALLGAAGDVSLSDGVTGQDHARRLVGRILDEANGDESGKLWCSLSDELQLLAEASPEAFLDAVHADLDSREPVLRRMFQDDDSGSALFTSSPHTGLLWALELLCWTPDFLPDASRALARLAAIDPGGRLSNRPLASLSSVLVGWIRHTGAPIATKVESLEQITRETPNVAWRLILDLWPSQHAVASPPAAPRFRDWKPESRGVSVAEWTEFVQQLVRLAIDLADNDAERWARLSERLGPLPNDQRELVLKALDRLARKGNWKPADQLTLWEGIDREVARHRRFQSADWAMDDGLLTRMQEIASHLEPVSDVARHAYLFDWRPDLSDVESDGTDYEEALAQRRRAALEETLAPGSLDGLHSLAERSKAHGQLGWVVAEVAPDELTADLLSWLDSDAQPIREVATAWAARKLHEGGVGWLRATLERSDMRDQGRREALVLAAPANSEVWDVLAETDPGLFHAYWQKMNVWRVDAEDAEQATDELLSHDRPWPAVDLLTFALHKHKDGETENVAPQLVAKVLDRALASELDTASQSPGYEVGVLLDYLEAQDYSATELVKFEFAFFALLDHHREPRALYSALRQNPDLFVDLVKRVYRGKSEKPRRLSERDSAMAHHAWRILNEWHQLPGTQEDGGVEASHLDTWVQDARLALSDSDRADIGDEQIGAVLSASPQGADGAWPAEPVRDLIERIGSTSMETGLHVGVRNSRGITSRGVYDGGDQEREIAERYRTWARPCASRWPRTSRVLRTLADSYEHEAHMHDVDAEVTGDVE